MQLVDRYVHEVGRHLPRKLRTDIETEIRSTIEDTLEGYAEKQDSDVDEDMVVEVLREFGPPQKVAASYRSGKQYLVGPELFPIFKIVLAVFGSVMTVLFLIGIVTTFGQPDDFVRTALDVLVSRVPEFISTLVGALGIIVIIFAILERVLPPLDWDDDDEAWDPAKLPKLDDPARANRLELILGITFTVVLLIFFNFLPQRVGIYFYNDVDGWSFISLLQEGYAAFMPWINVWGISVILLRTFVLRQGRWQTGTRLVEIGINLLGLFVLYQIFTSGTFFGFNPEWSSGSYPTEIVVMFEELAPLFSWVFKGLGVFILVVSLIEIIKQVYRLIRS
jgi:hypothetical protein